MTSSSEHHRDPSSTGPSRHAGPTQPSGGDPTATTSLDRAYHVLLEAARQLGSSLEPEAIFARMRESVCAAMGCDGMIVSSFDRATSVIRCEHAWVNGNVLDPSTLPPLTYRPDGGGMQSQVIRTGRPMLFSDVAERVRDPKGTYYDVDRAGGLRDLRGGAAPTSRSAIMVPLRLEGEVVGVVQVMADAEGVFTPADLELLEGISLLLAVALENARLYRQANDDLEERRRAERVLRQAEERYRAFVSHSTEGIYRLEFEPPIDVTLPVEAQVRLAYERGRIEECNDAFARMYAYERGEQMIGLGLDELLPSSDPACRAYLEQIIESGYHVADAESEEVDRHGNPVFFSNNILGVVEDGWLCRMWGTQRDISDRRRTEEALRDADRRKDEFLATLGHELRNPLNPIRNAVELLHLKGSSDPDVRWSHEVIDRQVVHLARLIDDLLDVGRITQGKLELRRDVVDLGDVLHASVEQVRRQVEEAGQRLTFERLDRPVLVLADPVRLAQVFSNLLDNATKFTAPGGHIDVSVERRGDHAQVSVRDDGAGLDRDQIPHVFDLFYQGTGPQGRIRGGLGIGLTLVKRLLEMHGGGIEVSSEGAGRGSLFSVQLPLANQRAASAAAMGDDARLARLTRVVVADDNHDSADTMAMLLRNGGNEVHVAYDGEDACRLADRLRPEVMLLDIGMPRLNGYEVAKRLRAEPWGREMVLIAATGWGQEEDRRRSAEMGFDAHLVKPVDHLALQQLIGKLLARPPAR